MIFSPLPQKAARYGRSPIFSCALILVFQLYSRVRPPAKHVPMDFQFQEGATAFASIRTCNYLHIQASPNQLWCPVLQDYYDKEDVNATHVVPFRPSPSVVGYIFEKGTSARLNSPDTFLLLDRTVEPALGNGKIVLLPADPTESLSVKHKG
jgi:hypothetical protein